MQDYSDSAIASMAKLDVQVESVRTALLKLQDQLTTESRTITECKTRLLALENQTTTVLNAEFARIKAVIDPLSSSTMMLHDKLSEFNKILERHQVELDHVEGMQIGINEKISALEHLVYDLDHIKQTLGGVDAHHDSDVEMLVCKIEALESVVSENTSILNKLKYMKSLLVATITGMAGIITFLIMVREHILQFMSP